jgi:hypothetical protein
VAHNLVGDRQIATAHIVRTGEVSSSHELSNSGIGEVAVTTHMIR